MASQLFFHVLIDFKNKKEISYRPSVGSFSLKDKCSKSSTVCFLKQLFWVYLIYQSNKCKMNTSAKFCYISLNEKAKIAV